MATIEIKDTKGKKVGTRRPRRRRLRHRAQHVRDAPGGAQPDGRAPRGHARHQDPRRGLAAAARSRGARRAPAAPARARPARRSGRAAAWSSDRTRAATPSRCRTRSSSSRCARALSAKLADERALRGRRLRLRRAVDEGGRRGARRRSASTGRVTVVVANDDVNALLSFRNLAQGARHHRVGGQHLRPRGQHRRAVHQAGPRRGSRGCCPRCTILATSSSARSSRRSPTTLIEQNRYTFEVAKTASKPQIAQAVTEIFDVTVTNVNTMNVTGKPRRVRYAKGKTRDWKKAVVTLKEGDSIEFFPSRARQTRASGPAGCSRPAAIWSRPAPW